MPNWVKNIIHIEGPSEYIPSMLDFVRDKEDPSRIDFNNIIPMPERLSIVAGGYDKYYVALYLSTLSETEKHDVGFNLWERRIHYYGNYYEKYHESFTVLRAIPDNVLRRMKSTFKEEYETIFPESMEDVGKAYIDNILEYGHDTWYEWCCENWGTKWNACEVEFGEDYLEFETAWSAPFPIIKMLSAKFPELTFRHEWADEDIGRNCGMNEVKNGIITMEHEFESGEEEHEFACLLWSYDPNDKEEE